MSVGACGFESHPGHERRVAERTRFLCSKISPNCCQWTDVVDIGANQPNGPFDLHGMPTSRIVLTGIFEGALLEEIIEHGHHMKVPAGTLLMDVGQQMEAVLFFLMAPSKSCGLTLMEMKCCSISWNQGTVARSPWAPT